MRRDTWSISRWASSTSATNCAAPQRLRSNCRADSEQLWQLVRADRRLQFDVFGQAFGAELASDAGLLESAERTTGIQCVHVDAVGARADLRGDLQTMRGIGGPHRTGQPVVAVVGDAD